MTETSTAPAGRARHWVLDTVLGAGAALGLITIAHAALPDAPRTSQLSVRTPPAATSAREVAAEPVALIAFRDPVAGEEVVSPFGLRQLPWEENGRLHEGVDIAADFGEPVVAAADGVVVRSGNGFGYGRFVEVRHAEGLTTLYAHMGGVADGMRPGVAIKAGQAVGRVGSSGTSTGPHLHFEIRDRKTRPLNPTLFLGRTFADAEELPLTDARRFGRRVRIAYVSRIPESKKALMEAKLAGRALSATDQGRDASAITVLYGDGRPRATYRFAPANHPIVEPARAEPAPADDGPIATSG